MSTAKGKRVPEYQAWQDMIKRCTRPSNPYYKDYGGRGITVCEQWLTSFAAFFAELGPRPSPKHSLDRKNNNLGYIPGNCRWATKAQQNQNHRRVKLTMERVREIRCLAANDVPQSELSRRFGVNQSSISLIVNNKTWRDEDVRG